jgi:hypothetical protein|nr:MAG TPA: hypothetical protein [Caudoviricetes sp.]
MKDQELVKALREHAEWARANEWETPITLGDDLAEAADRIEAQAKEIEKLRGQLRHLCRNCDLDRLEKLAEADRDGRVVVRPCKVGDTLFRVFAGEILEHKVRNMRYLAIQGRWDIDTTPFCSYVESSIGKTIFLTSEEAKAALEAMKDE